MTCKYEYFECEDFIFSHFSIFWVIIGERLDAWLMRRYSEELGDLDCVPPGTWTLLHEEYKLTYPSVRLRYKTPNDLRDRRKGIQRVIDRKEKLAQQQVKE